MRSLSSRAADQDRIAPLDPLPQLCHNIIVTSQLTIPEARASLPPDVFRAVLRKTLLEHPEVTLREVAKQLGVTRQRVSLIVGRLDRPSCAHPDRPAPKKEHAARLLPQLVSRVRAGEAAEHAARELGVSLAQAARLGFRSREVRPPHGTQGRLKSGCDCWRCRRAGGIALPRGPRAGARTRAEVADWLAWTDPENGCGLTQAEIGRLAGVGQGAVSRIARAGGLNGN